MKPGKPRAPPLPEPSSGGETNKKSVVACKTKEQGFVFVNAKRRRIPRAIAKHVELRSNLFSVAACLTLASAFPTTTGTAVYFAQMEPPKKQAQWAVVTAYSSSPDETDEDPFVTASGEQVREGIVACSREFPFGTRFSIDGKVYECLDRLAPKYDRRFDIWMASKMEALKYGKQQLLVELVEEGDTLDEF